MVDIVESEINLDDLSILEKRRAAEAIVDAAVLSHWARGESTVTQETRERWIRLIIEKPELTEDLFASSKFGF